MKKSEKLELYAALILQPMLLIYLFLSLIYFGFENATPPIFILWLLSLLITFGAYFQTIRKSAFGFWMTLIGAVLFTLFSGMLAFAALYSGASVLLLLAVVIPLILSIAVAVFAVSSLD
jgi:hypothetical protein